MLGAAALLAALLAYYALFRRGPNLPTSADVVFVGFVLIPAVFALVWFALPLRHLRGLLGAGVAFAVLAVVATRADLPVVANFSKLAAATLVAFWFLTWFESALWVALVAVLIPVVDAYSVWRGPTRHIIEERPEVFTALSFSFPLSGERQALVRWRPASSTEYWIYRDPGPDGALNERPLTDENGDGRVSWLEAELRARRDYTYRIVAVADGERRETEAPARWREADGETRRVPDPAERGAPAGVTVESAESSAKLGLPDLLFFALFLAAADRFRLRVAATWLAMALSFGLTLAGTYFLGVDGLPALPLLAIAFLLVNADRLWRAFRARRAEAGT